MLRKNKGNILGFAIIVLLWVPPWPPLIKNVLIPCVCTLMTLLIFYQCLIAVIRLFQTTVLLGRVLKVSDSYFTNKQLGYEVEVAIDDAAFKGTLTLYFDAEQKPLIDSEVKVLLYEKNPAKSIITDTGKVEKLMAAVLWALFYLAVIVLVAWSVLKEIIAQGIF